ncbi:MAG: ABC transporter substrate-binding protein [Pseudonocardiaceae bacterium]|nr:ABC transporter substrate-binding protein [Pseudonocardiaceae bacterium]
MRRPRWLAAGAIPLAVALAITGCSGGDGGDNGDGGTGGDPAKNESTEVTVFGSEPARPLVPGDTAETGGGKIVDAMWTGLMEYDPVSGEPGLAHAESFELTAPDEFTIKLKKGWKFHDGTEVKAHNYIDAWNYTAYSPNAQQHSSFFTQIAGFSDVNTPDPDGPGGPQAPPTPKATEMSGLTEVNDYEFTVKFSAPHAIFKVKTGYSAYMPLPDSFFADPEAFKANPVGSGPWRYVARVPDQEVQIQRFDDYQGDDKPKVKNVKFVFTDADAAYADIKGNQLDFLDTVPPQGIAGNVWETDLPGRAKAYPVMAVQTISFPVYDQKYNNVDFRHAVSMAIDREKITQTIFEGNRKPLNGYGMSLVQQRRQRSQGMDRGGVRHDRRGAGGRVHLRAGAGLRPGPPGHRGAADGPDLPFRVARRLPADRELPQPDLPHRWLVQRQRLLQPRGGREARGRRQRGDRGGCLPALPRGGGADRRGHAWCAAVGHPVHQRVVGAAHQRAADPEA